MPKARSAFGRFRLWMVPLLLDERPGCNWATAHCKSCANRRAKGALASRTSCWPGWAGGRGKQPAGPISTLRKASDPEGTGESWMTVAGSRISSARRRERRLARGHPAEPAPACRNNLPQLANALIGRDSNMTLLSRYRLVTLVGGPGVGKTSLSLQVGADLLRRTSRTARGLSSWHR